MATLYNVLEVKETATQGEINQSYKRLALKHHPDKNLDNKVQAEEQFKQIGSAYEILKDVTKRQEYDQKLQTRVSDIKSYSGRKTPAQSRNRSGRTPPNYAFFKNPDRSNIFSFRTLKFFIGLIIAMYQFYKEGMTPASKSSPATTNRSTP